MSRDRDIRNAMRDALAATGAFADVILGRPMEDYATGAVGGDTCQIEPLDENQKPLWDEGNDYEVTARVRCTFTARNEDPQLRDEAAERLYNVARNALDYQSLADLTLPPFTSFGPAKKLAPKHPERQIEAIYTYRYVVEDNTFDTTE